MKFFQDFVYHRHLQHSKWSELRQLLIDVVTGPQVITLNNCFETSEEVFTYIQNMPYRVCLSIWSNIEYATYCRVSHMHVRATHIRACKDCIYVLMTDGQECSNNRQ